MGRSSRCDSLLRVRLDTTAMQACLPESVLAFLARDAREHRTAMKRLLPSRVLPMPPLLAPGRGRRGAAARSHAVAVRVWRRRNPRPPRTPQPCRHLCCQRVASGDDAGEARESEAEARRASTAFADSNTRAPSSSARGAAGASRGAGSGSAASTTRHASSFPSLAELRLELDALPEGEVRSAIAQLADASAKYECGRSRTGSYWWASWRTTRWCRISCTSMSVPTFLRCLLAPHADDAAPGCSAAN